MGHFPLFLLTSEASRISHVSPPLVSFNLPFILRRLIIVECSGVLNPLPLCCNFRPIEEAGGQPRHSSGCCNMQCGVSIEISEFVVELEPKTLFNHNIRLLLNGKMQSVVSIHICCSGNWSRSDQNSGHTVILVCNCSMD
ncbi:hypothetical protein CISG_02382 [Coccidioides immitis RMSCC 3703]|uniref:Uncharacterized protein n=1 Tax=Coccidioides immitis RMSCC 3703 TaxID=454286 RepID=A0A0J8R6R4_COCIT|nr:hypothetical protein CISG_02382 [Coccidioides immitis RMSCC 3703]